LLLSSGNFSEKITLAVTVSARDSEKTKSKTSKTQPLGEKPPTGFKLKDKISVNLSKFETEKKENKSTDIMVGVILTIILIAIIFTVVYILSRKSPPKPFIESVRRKH